jgi:pyruvate kinase
MDQQTLDYFLHGLKRLQNLMLQAEKEHQTMLLTLPAEQRSACSNLLHYLALRSEDLRDLQLRLHVAGLSSLASAESHIYAQLSAIMERLGIEAEHPITAVTYDQAIKNMVRNAVLLFGVKRDRKIPYIMVTFDSDYADNLELVKGLLVQGMNVARINCAHDDEAVWSRMIENLKKATAQTGLPCKIYMDLAGPKIRTKLFSKRKKKHKLELQEGEKLLLVGPDASVQQDGLVPVVGCSLEGIVGQLKVGARVLFDDGVFACLVEAVHHEVAELKVTRISSNKPYLKASKGINFPDSILDTPSLTDFDLDCLPFVCSHADLVGYSFVRSAHDIERLQLLLSKAGPKKPYIILKIEMPDAVKHLPDLLIQGMRERVFGVMIARGDLAIELGFERMGEVQEEILWFCEAAHVPVIWATQVLETLNKSGLATRSEITDAGFSFLAECVMINKGKHIVDVMTTLRDIFHRSGGHHAKKRYLFRPLHIATDYLRP